MQRGQDFCTELGETIPAEEQVTALLLQHPAVVECEVIEGIAYVMQKNTSGGKSVLVEDWELKEYLMAKMTQHGHPRSAVPKLRLAEHLPGETAKHCPFTILHILDALFTDANTSGNEAISLEEFASFCQRNKLFEDDSAAANDLFFSACSRPTTSEILFGGGQDMFQDVMNVTSAESNISKLTFFDFQRLILEAGIVEMTKHEGRTALAPGVAAPVISYFIDAHVVEIILKKWFAIYDVNSDGFFTFDEYARLVQDYNLHFAISDTAFQRLAEDGRLDLSSFQNLLVQSGLLETGTSVEKDDEAGRVWRSIEETQQFLPQKRVFIADGREGTSPPKTPNSIRFVCISDTHGQHRELTRRLPPGDVLLHGGDFSMAGELDEVLDFGAWVKELQYERKIFISGNHDLCMDRTYEGHHSKNKTDGKEVRHAFKSVVADDDSVVYLEDGEFVHRGIRIYGTPWQPDFGFWAFNLPRGEPLAEKWSAVPHGTDILIVHGPPLGRGDACLPSNKRMGCSDLLRAIQEDIRPSFVVCGHIHEAAGVTFDGTTHYLNACSLNENYECVHPPLVFDVPLDN